MHWIHGAKYVSVPVGVQVMGADAAADKVEADICRLINDGQSSYYGCDACA